MNEAERESYEERAAIVHEANIGWTIEEAEAFALQCTRIASVFDALSEPMQVQTGPMPARDSDWPVRSGI